MNHANATWENWNAESIKNYYDGNLCKIKNYFNGWQLDDVFLFVYPLSHNSMFRDCGFHV